MTDKTTFYEKYLKATPQELASYGYILQDVVRRYPWFSLGHMLLFKSLCGLGGDAYLSESEKQQPMCTPETSSALSCRKV